MTTEFDICFSDLNEDCQQRLLEVMGRGSDLADDVIRDYNWDISPLTFAVIDIDKEE